MGVLCVGFMNAYRYLAGFVEGREKSSHYGLNMLGYTCATKANTVGSDSESLSKSLKIVPVRIAGCNSSA